MLKSVTPCLYHYTTGECEIGYLKIASLLGLLLFVITAYQSQGIDSTIRLGALRSIWEEKKIRFHGVMVIEGILSRRDALQILLKALQIYLVDVTAYFALQEIKASGITDLQGIVVPSPYWWLYLDWLSG